MLLNKVILAARVFLLRFVNVEELDKGMEVKEAQIHTQGLKTTLFCRCFVNIAIFDTTIEQSKMKS